MTQPSPLGVIGKFVGNTVGEAAAFAAGVAIGPVLEPLLQAIRNETWSNYPDKPIDVGAAARLVAQGLVDDATGQAEGKLTGYSADVFEYLVQLAYVAPGIGQALELSRRSAITDDQLDTALAKAQVLPEFRDAIKQLVQNFLDPAEIAKAIHRGIMKSDDELIAVPPTTPGNVPQVPQSPLDPIVEAAASGVDAERLRILVGNAGLPPGIVQMLQLMNRGVITDDDVLRGVGESNLRNEWGPAILALARYLLTPHDYAELQLRGFLTEDERNAGAALHGMTADDAELLYDLLGRSIPVHQITTGLARGGVYGGDTSQIPAEYLASLERGNLRPEYYNLAYANRFTYPSYFVIKPLVADGAITVADATQIFENEGWPPDLASAAAKSFASGTASTQKSATASALSNEYQEGHLSEADYRAALTALGYTTQAVDMEVDLANYASAKKYRDAVITAISKNFIDGSETQETAAEALTAAGVSTSAQTNLFQLWNIEKAQQRKTLSETQIVAVAKKGTLSEADASDALQALGYTADEAATLLGQTT